MACTGVNGISIPFGSINTTKVGVATNPANDFNSIWFD